MSRGRSCGRLRLLRKGITNVSAASVTPLRLNKRRKRRQWKYFFFALPFLLEVLLFSYIPLAGWALALFDYKPGLSLLRCKFVGLKYFLIIFRDKDVLHVLRNTLIFSGIGYLLSPMPMIFAVLLNEVNCRPFKKFTQTITTLPNFISAVIVFSMAFSIFSTDGVLNSVLMNFGLINAPTNALGASSNFVYVFQTLISQWRGLGWSSIVYIAAIAGIDQELYEAAKIDGAGRFRCAVHVTVPGLLPTYITLLVLSIASLLNTGYEQQMLFKNAFNADKIETLDLYIYRMGLQSFDYSYATGVGVVKSIFSITMLFGANAIAKRVRGNSIM